MPDHTHVLTPLANPHMACTLCGWQVTHTQDDGGPIQNQPCGHTAPTKSLCPTWEYGIGCRCKDTFGRIEHPPAPAVTP